MQKKKDVLIALINEWDAFEQKNEGASLDDFYVHKYLEKTQKEETAAEVPFIEGEILGMVGKMGGFASQYVKKALTKLDFKNVEEWVFLMTLSELKNPSKSELIYEMMTEFATGMDVIKRLIEKGWATESPDPDDKRSKRLNMTAEGEKTLFSSMPKMGMVGEMALGILTKEEKSQLYHLLKKLDSFHSEAFRAIKNLSFEESFETLTSQAKNQSSG